MTEKFTYDRHMSFRLPLDKWEKFREKAAAEGRNVSEKLRDLIGKATTAPAPPRQTEKQVTFQLTTAMHRDLVAHANAEGKSVQTWLRERVENGDS